MKIIQADQWYRAMNEEEIIKFLEKPLLMRIGFIDKDGYPIVHPVWFLYKNGKFIVLSHRNSKKVKRLRENPKVYFTIDIEKPTGVRGKGDAELLVDEEQTRKIMSEMLKKYGIDESSEIANQLMDEARESVIINIKPKFLATWIYE
ncbi:MAG: hypothetical protein KatS3mg003_0202 [Candidatus Nitrosocaldaceae archaeon]|nr:MAG: hypothetical protein KatS3mg003_0202 [Candidatus Nitrosocaldaceae archaeon]